jgi:hypothetical protein
MSTDLQTCRHAEPPPADSVCDDLPLFRFRLRQLLVFVAVLSVLLAAIVSTHGITAAALLLAVMVVMLHLFSTALGTQLRSHANRNLAHDATRYEANGLSEPVSRISRLPLARSPWHGRGSTPLPWLPMLVVAIGLVGGVCGALLLAGTIGHRTSTAGIAVGSVSIAIVSGWFAFVGGSFYGIVRHGIKDAMANDDRHQTR